MANPGRDIHNMKVDDVLADKRQREIAQVMEVLKRFRPTRIAIEGDLESERVAKQYADYLAGNYTLTRNETDQIAFRLAKELGHTKIYPVDEGGDFPYARVKNWAIANGWGDKFKAMEASIGVEVKRQNDLMQTQTVLETLLFMNSDSMVAKRIAYDFNFVSFGDRWDYAGPDLIAAWYQRNIRIYHNVVRLIESPSDRILVVYGAGHLGPLQQDAMNDPAVRLRKLGELIH